MKHCRGYNIPAEGLLSIRCVDVGHRRLYPREVDLLRLALGLELGLAAIRHRSQHLVMII